MKNHSKILLKLGLPIFLLLGAHPSRAAVTLNVSPANITNDFSGKITLTIGGLSAGQAVQVERVYDVNGDGIFEPATDVVVETFKLTDGQLPLFGGVRDINEPGDEDGTANGQITAQLNYPGLSTAVGGATGNFIFNVTDNQTGASLATHAFTVAQKVYPQGVRGRITSAASGLPLTNTLVVLLNPDKDGNALISVSDTNGNYNFFAPAAGYTVLVAQTGFVCDEFANFVTIATNQFLTNNLSLSNGVFAISGHLTDSANGKSNGVVFVNVQSTNNLFSGGFTDTNGNFSLPAFPGQWKLDIDEGALAQRGIMGPQNKQTVGVSNTSVSGVSIVVTKATALIFGTVKDSLNNAISGLSFTGDDSGGLHESIGLSGSNGAYTLAAVGGNWNVGPDGAAVLALGFTGTGTNVNVTDGTSVEADFVLQGVNAHIRGQVKDDHGNPIANIQLVVQPFPLDPSGANSLYPTTDTNGNFDVGVAGGEWNIALECVSAQQRSYVDIGGFNFNVTSGVDLNGLVLVFPQATATISGKISDSLGHPLEGITVNATQQINTTNFYFPGCVTTDSTGQYHLGVLGGTWSVSVGNQELEALGYNDVSPTNVTISGGTATANFTAVAALTAPKFKSGTFSPTTGTTLMIIGDVGHTNTVQFSSNLVNWLALTNTVLAGTNWQVIDPATNQSHRFYRAFVSP